MSNTNITYGDYDFAASGGPIPFLQINKEFLKTDDGSGLGSTYNITVEGTLTPILLPLDLGYVSIDDMQDSLDEAFSTDGLPFVVKCGSDILVSGNPIVNSIRFDRSNDNWTTTAPYTIDLTWEGEGAPGDIFVSSAQESWELQLSQDNFNYDWSLGGTGDTNFRPLQVSHSVSAKGVTRYSNDIIIKPAWQYARDWVVPRLGIDPTQLASSGVLNIATGTLSGYNHSRIESRQELDGTFSVSESWVAFSTGVGCAGNAIESFNAQAVYDVNNGLTSIDVNGIIEGVEVIDYGTNPGDFSVTSTKYASASGYFVNVSPKMFNRATLAAVNTAVRSINPQPLAKSVGHSPTQGNITYSYRYDDRPCNFISNALLENITVTDTHPTDTFATVPVLGRAEGPILQDINTPTVSKRSVSIDVIVNPSTDCVTAVDMMENKPTGDVATLLCLLETEISGSSPNYIVFKSQDQDSWNPKTGRYTRSVEWTYSTCNGDAPNTSFCP